MLNTAFRWAVVGLALTTWTSCVVSTDDPQGTAGTSVGGASGELGVGGRAGTATSYAGSAGKNADNGGQPSSAGGASGGTGESSAGVSAGGKVTDAGGHCSSGTNDSGGASGGNAGRINGGASGTAGSVSGGASGTAGSVSGGASSSGASGAGGGSCSLPPFPSCGAGNVCNQAGQCVPKLCEPLPANVPNCVKDFPCHIGHCSSADQPCFDLTVLLGLGFAPDGIACGSTPGATCHHGNCLTVQCGPGQYCDPSCTGADGAELPDGSHCQANFVCLSGICTNQLSARATPFTLATNLSISTTLATFTDSWITEASSNFTATVDWGDGKTSAGTVSGGAGSYSVSGSHTYASHAPVTVGIAIEDIVTTSSATVRFNAGYTLSEYPIQGPVGITVDALNVLWITQQSTNIARVSYQGVPTEFAAPAGSAVTHTANNGLWYLEPTKVALLSSDEDLNGGPTAIVVKEFPLPGPNRQTSGITTDAEGLDAWFTETGRIARITQAGAITEYTIPTPGSDPRGIAQGPDGNIWFTEYGASKIGIITPDGVITEFATPTPSSYPDGISYGFGSLWFTEAGNNAIASITTSGVITEYPLPTAAACPHAIIQYFYSLWFTEPGANQIGALTAQGEIIEYPIPTPNSMPWDIAGLEGIWFTERAANQLGQVRAPL